MATGWLGWPPSVAWSATVPEIVVALDAKIDFIKMTNPFGASKEKPQNPQTKEQVAAKFEALMMKTNLKLSKVSE